MTNRASTNRCRCCGTANQPYATFCLNCGEADFAADAAVVSYQLAAIRRRSGETDFAADTAVALPDHADPQRTLRWAGVRRWGAPILAGVALLGLLGGAGIEQMRRGDRAAQERDRLAQTAQAAEAAHNWDTAFSALSTLRRIHPADADLRERQTVAQAGVLAAALAGTVYSVAAGPEAGLYANLPALRGVPLPGSDGASRPLAWQPGGGALVYDRAGGAANPVRESVLARTHAANGLAASTQPDLLDTTALPPAVTPRLSGLFTPTGLLWPTHPRDDNTIDPLLVVYRFADQTTLRVSAGATGQYVAALDAAQGRLLLVDPPADPQQPISHFGLVTPGSAPQAIGSERGGLVAAQFAADGRHLLVTLQESAPTRLTQRIYLVHLSLRTADHPAEARWELLREQNDPRATPTEVRADFVPAADGHSHTVLLLERDRTTLRLTLHPMGSMETPLWQGTAPQWLGNYTLAPDGRRLAYVSGETGSGRLVVQRLVAGAVPQILNGAAFRSGALLDFAPDGRHLVYRSPAGSTPGATDTPTGSALYSLPLDDGDGTPASNPLRPSYLGTVVAGPAALALPPRGRLLLYLDPSHTAHAVAYDGTLDVALPGPVASVWSLR